VSRVYLTKIGERKELFMQAFVKLRGKLLSFARKKIGPSYIAYEKGIAAENPYRIDPSRFIHNNIGDVLRGMTRGLQYMHYHILGGNSITLGQGNVIKFTVGCLRGVYLCPGFVSEFTMA